MKKVLVVGAARSGSAVCKLLIKHGYDVYLTDMGVVSNKEELSALGVQVYEQGHPEALKHIPYAFIVKNPGIPYHAPFIAYFVQQNMQIYTEIEVASWFAKKFNYGAISGTNGKTTITTMLYELLACNDKAIVAGNIGIPLSECVLSYGEEEKDVALELSNFQLLGMESFAPMVSVICNLSADHLDYMKSEEAYYISKMRIYKNQSSTQYFLRNIDDAKIMQYAKDIPARVIDFSLYCQDVDLYLKDSLVYYQGTVLFDCTQLKVVGMHNISNAMIACCMAYLMGVSIEDIQRTIYTFTPVEHRLEFVVEKDGVSYYNDSKATNPEAVVPALGAFESNIILLAGGSNKGLSFDILKQYDSRIKKCFSFGETKEAFTTIFSNVQTCENMEEALAYANALAQPGDVILLSPACASYDQFTSYEHRGTYFKQLVRGE